MKTAVANQTDPTGVSALTPASGQGVQSAVNVARHLARMAKLQPDQPAVIAASRRGRFGTIPARTVTFAELEALSNRYANVLCETGVERGMRVLMLVKPGVDFVALVFSLLKIGAPPVLIDPGMGVRRMLSCIGTVKPAALIGNTAAHLLTRIAPSTFAAMSPRIWIGRGRKQWGVPLLARADGASNRFEAALTAGDDEAAVLFTSGATGPAKGVVYEHSIFEAQVRRIQACYDIQPGEMDLSCFPLFALFGPAMGMSSVFPDMNPSRPATADPARVVQAAQDYGVTSSFGSPAVWERVSRHCVAFGIRLTSLRRVLIAGAPVSWRLVERVRSILGPDADVHTPYGATESLPIASISGTEIVNETREQTREGAGICVGRPLPDIDLRVIRISDDPIESWSDRLSMPHGEIGEVVVAGDVVTRQYAERPDATNAAKIQDAGRVRHRMGDVGYLDDQGRLWFCGRKAHRVRTAKRTYYPICCEAIFNEHADVFRSALVRIGGREQLCDRPAIVVELESSRGNRLRTRGRIRKELLALGEANTKTAGITDVLFKRTLPVDVRHNAKIDRQSLADWASERLA